MDVRVEPLAQIEDIAWCAGVMSSNEPWLSLRRDYAACLSVLQNAEKERYLVRADGERAGLLILDMHGPFAGYIQTICLAASARNRGLGARVIQWAETHIFNSHPNVFMCVSSFNTNAQRLYERLGYEVVGTLKHFVVDEHDELLLRKTQGSWEAFRARRK
jgi:ribosomal-protein-alanine N-acetyltransferase